MPLGRCAELAACARGLGDLEQGWGKEKDKCEPFLSKDLFLSESLEQESKLGPLVSALCLSIHQCELHFNYLC